MDWGNIPKDWYCFVWPGRKSATIAEPCEIVEVPHRFKSQAETRLVINGKVWNQEQYRVKNEPGPHVVLYEPQKWDFDFRIDYKLEEELKLVEMVVYETITMLPPAGFPTDIWNPIIRHDGAFTSKEKKQIEDEIKKLIEDDQHILVLPEDVTIDGALNDPSITARRPYRVKHVLAYEREVQEMMDKVRIVPCPVSHLPPEGGYPYDEKAHEAWQKHLAECDPTSRFLDKTAKVFAVNPDGTNRLLGVCSDFKVGKDDE